MRETVKVRHLINGTVVDDTHTAERISVQTWRKRKRQPALIKLWRDGHVAEYIAYSDAPRIHRIIHAADLESP